MALDWLSLGSGLLGSIIDNFGADKRAQRDREWNSAEAEKNRQFQTSEREAAQEWNLEQWNRENEYNSPKEQLRRAVEAGMNPNVAMQGIAGNSNASQLTTSGQSGSVAGGKMNSTMSNFGGSVNNYWSAMLAKEQLTDLRETRPEREEETAASGEEKRESANVKREEAENLRQERKNLIKVGEKLGIEKDQLEFALNKAKLLLDSEVEAAKAYADKLREEIETEKKKREVMDEQIETEESTQAANYAAANNSNAQAANAEKQGEILDEELTVAKVKATLANDYGITNGTDADAAMMIKYAKGEIDNEEWNKWIRARTQKRNADNLATTPVAAADKGVSVLVEDTKQHNEDLEKNGKSPYVSDDEDNPWESGQYGVSGAGRGR